MLTNRTTDRTLGAFPISIGTSIALEHLLGVLSEANPEPKANSIGKYKEFWFNIRTLYRNLVGCVNKEHVNELLPDELATALANELEVISNVVKEYSSSTVIAKFYVSNYENVDTKFKMAFPRKDHTPKQLTDSSLMKASIGKLLAKHKTINEVPIEIFKFYLKPSTPTDVLILTHIAYDLVAYPKFRSLTLIESHTGKIKGRDQFYTKYYDGKNLPSLPFLEGLIPVFGDNEFFKALGKKDRDQILDIAKKYHWSSVTTVEKIKYTIGLLSNPYLKTVVLSFF